jgi:hypothetical protein
MKRLISVAVLAFASLAFMPASPAMAQTYQGNGTLPSTLCSAITPGFPTACAPTIGDTPYYAAATLTLTQFIAAPTAPAAIRITYLQFEGFESATGGELLLEQGTGTNCATNTAIVAKLAYLTATSYVSGSLGYGPEGTIFQLKPGYAGCVVISAGTVTSAAIAGMYSAW